MTKIFRYYDNWDGSVMTCEKCGWKGKVGHNMTEIYEQLLDITCPKCDEMLAIINFPTYQETENAAKKGNKEALKNLPAATEHARRMKQFEETKLKTIEQLPEITGKNLEFIFDLFFEKNKGEEELVTIITHDKKVIWKELGLYECVPRFNELKNLLKKKYGKRFKSLKPTERSGYPLYGDKISAIDKIEFE